MSKKLLTEPSSFWSWTRTCAVCQNLNFSKFWQIFVHFFGVLMKMIIPFEILQPLKFDFFLLEWRSSFSIEFLFYLHFTWEKGLVVHFSKCLKTFSSFLLKNVHQNKHCNPWSNFTCWEWVRSLKWLLEPLQNTMLQHKKFRTRCWFGGHLMILNDMKLILNHQGTQNDLGSIW